MPFEAIWHSHMPPTPQPHIGLFVLVRCFSYVVDGAPTITYAYLMWGGETIGAAVAAILYYSSGAVAAEAAAAAEQKKEVGR